MIDPENPHSRPAPGYPGMDPRWTQSNKESIGTAYHTSCRLWYTLSHGIVNEIYYPCIDTPNTRDLQFLVTDGETFCHEERRHLDHEIHYPEKGTLLQKITNTDPGGRYRIVKEVLAEPHSSVLLIHARLEILEPSLRGKIRLYALLAPHMRGLGNDNSARWSDDDQRKLLHAWRAGSHLVFGALPEFRRRSVGFAGTSDGWQDLMENFRMDWEYTEALHGNVAMLAELELSPEGEVVLGVGFGNSRQSAAATLLQALAEPFAEHRQNVIAQWQRVHSDCGEVADLAAHTGDGGSMFRLSRCILLAHEDKLYQGALVASLSIPWGETKGDTDLGGYHLVWPRDMMQSAVALLAAGHRETALRALVWMSCVQSPDGSMPQNSWIDGQPYWKGRQLDEVAAPVLLAWHLRKHDALQLFDAWTVVSRAVRYLVLHGPVTEQERWEENAGYSPSTLAAIIAALIGAADFADDRPETSDTADFLRDHADWLSDHIEEWSATTRGDLVPGISRHFIRLNPADPARPDIVPDPNTAIIHLKNDGGSHPARRIVGGDFLALVRLGVRAADDPLIRDSLKVIDHELKFDLPAGPSWRRYNFDGYGQKVDGSAFDGTGFGGPWPLLTGERGHYELAAGNDPLPFIKTLERFANAGGMLPEQVWHFDDLPERELRKGAPTGAAMPLCWAHAEYLSLVRSFREGVCFDRIDSVHERYAVNHTSGTVEIWTFAHQSPRILPGRLLRLVFGAPATVVWSADNWGTASEIVAESNALDLWTADLPVHRLAPGTVIEFTFHWETHWEGHNFSCLIGSAEPGDG